MPRGRPRLPRDKDGNIIRTEEQLKKLKHKPVDKAVLARRALKRAIKEQKIVKAAVATAAAIETLAQYTQDEINAGVEFHKRNRWLGKRPWDEMSFDYQVECIVNAKNGYVPR
jgi:hypothetical protein